MNSRACLPSTCRSAPSCCGCWARPRCSRRRGARRGCDLPKPRDRSHRQIQHVPPRPPRRRPLQEHRTMFAYFLNLALRSFRRNKVLTALMVLAIALGIGASMTTLTVFHVLSGDPVPTRSGELFYVQLDPAGMNGFTPGEEPAEQVTRFDAETLQIGRAHV